MIKKPRKPLELAKKKQDPQLLSLVESLNKKYGENAVILGVSKETYPTDFISTGILQLDADLGGGIAIGRYTEISGKESSTKTTLSLHILANAQRKGLTCALFDVEGTSDSEEYLTACGVDVSRLLYFRPTSLEELGAMLDSIQTSGKVKFAVYDSIACSMTTRKELSMQVGDSFQMGIPQSELGSIFRRFQMSNNRFFRTGEIPFTLIGINQLREKIGAYGDPEYTPGGRTKDFTSSCNIRLRQGDWIKEGQNTVGQVVKYKISKNKLFYRNLSGEVDFYFQPNSEGIPPLNYDVVKDTIIVAIGKNIIERAGAWYSYKDKFKVQGIPKVVEEIKSNPELMDMIYGEVMNLAKKE